MVYSLNVTSIDTLVIGTKISKPFVYKSGDDYNGLAFDVIKGYLGDKPYIVKEMTDLSYDEIINNINTSGVDIFIGNVTITSDRLENCEFSQPYFVTNTSIVTKDNGGSSLPNLLTYEFMESMLSLLLFIFLLERRH